MSSFISPSQIAAIALLLLSAVQTFALSTPPVGGVLMTVPNNSSRDVAIAVERPPAFQGYVGSVSGNRVVLKDAVDWEAGRFAPGSQSGPSANPETYYARFVTGALEGWFFKITASDATGITLELPAGPSPLTAVAPWTAGTGTGDLVKIVPYWTPVSWFQNGTTNLPHGIVPTINMGSPGSIVHMVSRTGDEGANAIAEESLVYRPSGSGVAPGWYRLNTAQSVDHLILPPDRFYQITNESAVPQMVPNIGQVVTHKMIARFSVVSGARRENNVGFELPVPVKLASLGLAASGAFRATTDLAVPQDILYLASKITPGDYDAFIFRGGASAGWVPLGSDETTLPDVSTIIDAATPLFVSKVAGFAEDALGIFQSPFATGAGGDLEPGTPPGGGDTPPGDGGGTPPGDGDGGDTPGDGGDTPGEEEPPPSDDGPPTGVDPNFPEKIEPPKLAEKGKVVTPRKNYRVRGTTGLRGKGVKLQYKLPGSKRQTSRTRKNGKFVIRMALKPGKNVIRVRTVLPNGRKSKFTVLRIIRKSKN